MLLSWTIIFLLGFKLGLAEHLFQQISYALTPPLSVAKAALQERAARMSQAGID
jgi:hypothetical protein